MLRHVGKSSRHDGFCPPHVDEMLPHVDKKSRHEGKRVAHRGAGSENRGAGFLERDGMIFYFNADQGNGVVYHFNQFARMFYRIFTFNVRHQINFFKQFSFDKR